MHGDSLIIFMKFLQHSTYKSKKEIYEEFRRLHPDLGMRALVFRTIDAIAEKRRQENAVHWEVKTELLQKHGLQSLVREFPYQKEKSSKTENETTKSESDVSPTPPNHSLNGNKRKRNAATINPSSVNILQAFLKKKLK